MKYLWLFIFSITTGCSYGQLIKGTVTDKDTKLPVGSALVSLGDKQAYTNSFGEFSIAVSGNDSLRITHFAYKAYTSVISRVMSVIHIELEPARVALREVVVHSNRELDFKNDSAANRIFYAKEFNYKGPVIMDAFTEGSGNPVKNTSQLINLNVLTLIKALTKKSTAEYKFNKILLRDEHAGYVDQKFNRGIAAKVTGLKGDTLSAFVIQYRPTYEFAKKATDYEMELYIKTSYKKFLKGGFKGDDVFRRKSGDAE